MQEGERTADGRVVYHGSNDADVVVIPTVTGAQFLTVVNSTAAPEEYVYPVVIPQGGRIELSNEGSAVVLDSTGRPVARIAPAWALDAKLRKVATRFTTNGTTLTQHIAHKANGVNYPVVADPNVTFGPINFTLWYGKQEVKDLAPQFWGHVLSTAIGVACGNVKWAQAVCAAVIAGAWFWIDRTFDEAATNNQCVWISVSYGADLDGWGRYDC